MALSYEFSIGSVRAKENSLLSSADIERMLACKSTGELCRFLKDKGYGEGNTVDEILISHSKDMWAYLKGIAPDFELFSPFLLQNDIHNIKTVLKAIMSAKSYNHLLLSPTTVSTELIVEAVENKKFSILPEWLIKPCEQAYDALAHKSDARLSDAILDRAAMEEMLKASEKSSSRFVYEYFCATVFYSNVKIAIRGAKSTASKDFFEDALCEVKDFSKNAVISNAVKGLDALLGYLEKISAYGCSAAIEQYKKSPSAFEKYVDDRLIKAARETCKRTSEGAEPIIGYMIGCEAEKKVIHIIDCGIKTATDVQVIRERLREIYG